MTTSPESSPIPASPSRLGAWVRRNPVALKELRGRMRGARAFVVLTVYVALMSLFAVTLYLIYTTSASISLTTTGGVIGKLIFGGVVAIELFLVCFVAPSFTAGAISGERERRTFNLLRTTLLSARRFVFGKLLSALAYIVLLLLVAVPLQSLAFLMGGITVLEVLLSIVLLLVTAIAYGSVGLFFSAVTRRTLTASILTYTFALVVTIALPLLALVLGTFSGGALGGGRPLLQAILTYAAYLIVATNPIATAIMTEILLQQQGALFITSQTLSNGASIPLVSPWVIYTLLYLAVSAVLILLTVRAVRHTQASD
jgi:ABC-2 type transport system permease protein